MVKRQIAVVALWGGLGCSGISERTVLEVAGGSGAGTPAMAQGGQAGGISAGGVSGAAAQPGGGMASGGAPVIVDEECADSPNPAPLRSLSSWEYARSVAVLTGAPITQVLPPDPLAVPPFAVSMDMSAATMAALFAEAELQGAAAVSGPTPSVELACEEEELVDVFLEGVFGRPLLPAERDRYWALCKLGSALDGPNAGVSLVVQAALFSPLFLYKIYRGEGAVGTRAWLTGFEVASRASHLLAGQVPDPSLWDPWDRGELSPSTGAGVHASARQLRGVAEGLMKGQPFGHAASHFHAQWFGLDLLANVQTPGLTPELRATMRAETDAFIADLFVRYPHQRDLFHSEDGSFGVLTQASTLTRFSNPTQRGLLVRDRMLCMPVPPPPPAVIPDIELLPNQTRRTSWEQHRTDPACAGCHQLMDPIGFGLESFDALGRERSTDNGFPIDSSGELIQAGDIEGPFQGVAELAERLSGSSVVAECLTKTWLTYALQRPLNDADSCAVDRLRMHFEQSGFDFKALLGAIVSSNRFRMRDAHPSPPASPPAGPDGNGSLPTIMERRKAVLDFTLAELQWFRQVVPIEDVPLVEQHLTAVRELEMQLSQLPN